MNLLDLMVKIGVDDQASDKVDSIGGSIKAKLGGVASAAAKAVAAGVAAIGTGTVAMGTSALKAYSTYEQMVGGVDKLYWEASGRLQAYAAQAYQTSGMSANQYMQQATTFSAALINSLGGDTAKAADMADVAMRAMSDNVNVFGSNAEDVQNAIMGISRQNYTMLDNLKLGYAGTKEGMQQLIKDANAWGAANGEASDLSIDSFADCVQAIQQVQEAQGIAGTTAKEAAGTIEGSVAMAKAAWEDYLTGIANTDADMGQLTQNLLTAIGDVAANVGPRVVEIGSAIVSYLPQTVLQVGQTLLPVVPDAATCLVDVALSALSMLRKDLMGVTPQAVQDVVGQIAAVAGPLAQSIVNTMPALLSALMSILTGVIEWLAANSQTVVDSVVSVVGRLSNMLIEHGPELLAAAGQLFMNLASAIIQDLPDIVETLTDLLVMLVQTIAADSPAILAGAVVLFAMLAQAVWDVLPQVLSALLGLLAQAVSTVAGAVGQMLSAGLQIMGGLLSGVAQKGGEVLDWFVGLPGRILSSLGDLGSLLFSAGKGVLQGFLDGLKSAWGAVTDFVGGIADWIAEHKGPIEYDRRLLVPHGMAIMRGLGSGIERAFGADVVPLVSGIGDRIADAMAIDGGLGVSPAPAMAAAGAAGAVGAGATIYNLTVDGATVNGDEHVRGLFLDLLTELQRRAAMNVG